MSHIFSTSPGGIDITEFHGGERRGLCLQVGDDLQLTLDEAEWLLEELRLWVAEQRRR